MGWHFGFKLHLIINDRGELLAFKLTPGNTDDHKPVPEMSEGIFGKLFGDRGYISQKELTSVIGNRQKHKGMSWRSLGSRALAILARS